MTQKLPNANLSREDELEKLLRELICTYKKCQYHRYANWERALAMSSILKKAQKFLKKK